jgi:hypothetical protein
VVTLVYLKPVESTDVSHETSAVRIVDGRITQSGSPISAIATGPAAPRTVDRRAGRRVHRGPDAHRVCCLG